MTLAIQRDNKQFLYQQVISMISEMQLVGSLRPGDKLPSLRTLSKNLKVSIPTVRQAYTELERQGTIEARPKSGYFLKVDIALFEQLYAHHMDQLMKATHSKSDERETRRCVEFAFVQWHVGFENKEMEMQNSKLLHSCWRPTPMPHEFASR